MSLFSFGQKKEPESNTQAQIVAASARVCLGMEQFKAYREQYDGLEGKIIDEMLSDAVLFSADKDCDLVKFGAKCLVKLTRLRDLRALLGSVESDAKKASHGDKKSE